jgi:hypothetical protein
MTFALALTIALLLSTLYLFYQWDSGELGDSNS